MDTCNDLKADLPDSPFCEEPRANFAASLDDCLNPDDPGQRRCAAFVEALRDVDTTSLKVDPTRLEVNTDRLPKEKVKRSEVFDLAAAPTVSVATVCVAAMAWGGMHLGSWKRLWNTSNGEWLNVAQRIRKGCRTREEAYQCLKALRNQKELKGMGPAFFTKLIYFLTPRDGPERKPGYIMDQWAGSSVNLLTGSDRVLLDATRTWERPKGRLKPSFVFTVSDENTSDDYEAFCCVVDRLACHFCLCVDQVDQALFSAGKPKPGTWRNYVTDNQPGFLGATNRIQSV